MTHHSRQRPFFFLIGACFCALFLLFGLLIFSKDSRTAALLFDLAGKIGAYPLTVQGLMWLMFFLALSDGLYLFLSINDEKSYLRKKLLPEETSKMISLETANIIYNRISSEPKSEKAIPFLVKKTLDQFFIAHSIGRSNEVFDSSMRMLVEKNELKFTFIRYVAWLLPTIGFIGTVIGISLALVVAAAPPH
ncbi:MotA/TolQ/ExbB proton channel family protein [Gammaproteobacteria bacterium]|nr:MotA/TolQ/ExbB proton channel family protein [Gammaproteobacteria bacterium]